MASVEMIYQCESDPSLHHAIRVGIPKKWLRGPCRRLLLLFISKYNDKFSGRAPPLEEAHSALRDETVTAPRSLTFPRNRAR